MKRRTATAAQYAARDEYASTKRRSIQASQAADQAARRILKHNSKQSDLPQRWSLP